MSSTVGYSHLKKNQRALLRRAAFTGVVGATPIPGVDEWLEQTVRSRHIKWLAEKIGIKLSHVALKELAAGQFHGTKWPNRIGRVVATKLATRTLRKTLAITSVLGQTHSASREYVFLTLLEHYFAKHHKGKSFELIHADGFLRAFHYAMKNTSGGALRGALGHAVGQSVKHTSARLQRWRGRQPVSPVSGENNDLQSAPEQAIASSGGKLVDRLSPSKNQYLRQVLVAFDEAVTAGR